MTLREWLLHLCSWLRTFPLPNDSGHFWVGLVGGDTETCLVCGRTQPDPDAAEAHAAGWKDGHRVGGEDEPDTTGA